MANNLNSRNISNASQSQASFPNEQDPIKRYQLVNQQERQCEREQVHRKVTDQRKKEDQKREKHLVH
jgi:hypothetical protein